MGTDINIPEDVSRDALSFTQRLLGPAADAADFLGDKIRFYRWQSALKTLERAKEIAEERNLELKEVPLKFLVPFLERASCEDTESELIERWSRLLLSAATDFDYSQLTYINVLSNIGPAEARLLDKLDFFEDKDTIGAEAYKSGYIAATCQEAHKALLDDGPDSINKIMDRNGEGPVLPIVIEWAPVDAPSEADIVFADFYEQNALSYDVLIQQGVIRRTIVDRVIGSYRIRFQYLELTPLGQNLLEALRTGEISPSSRDAE